MVSTLNCDTHDLTVVMSVWWSMPCPSSCLLGESSLMRRFKKKSGIFSTSRNLSAATPLPRHLTQRTRMADVLLSVHHKNQKLPRTGHRSPRIRSRRLQLQLRLCRISRLQFWHVKQHAHLTTSAVF